MTEEAGGGEGIISPKDMDDLVSGGQATSKITSEFGTVEGSSYMRQVGDNLYIKKDNPFKLSQGGEMKNGEEDDSYYWQLNRTLQVDASSGAGNGA